MKIFEEKNYSIPLFYLLPSIYPLCLEFQFLLYSPPNTPPPPIKKKKLFYIYYSSTFVDKKNKWKFVTDPCTRSGKECCQNYCFSK